MGSAISGWMYNIILFLLFSSLLLQLVAEKRYEKYVRFFSGIIIMLLVISPVLNWIGSENIMNFNYLEECFSQAAILASQETENINSLKEETVSKRYSMQIQLSLERIISAKGYELVDAEIDLEDNSDSSNYYYPKFISARISTGLHNEKSTVEPVSIDISNSKNDNVLDEGNIKYDEEIFNLKSEIAEFFSMEEEAVILEIVS